MTRISIRWRITLWNTAAFAIVLVGFGCLVYELLRKTHYDQVDRGLSSRYREILQDEALTANPRRRFNAWVRRFGKHIEISGLVFDEEGRVVARAEQLSSNIQLGSPTNSVAEPRFDSLTLPRLGHMRRLTVAVPTDHGPYTLMLLAELEHVDEELTLVIQALLITAPITLGMTAVLAYLLAYKALAPVEQLRRQTDEITAEHLDRRLPIHNPGDELGLLARTINSMIARLERSFDEIRRFTADASHELRTPIAVIRSEAEMGWADASRDSTAAQIRFRSIIEECGRLTAATNQLLTLSREDAGVDRAAREPVSLKSMLAEAVESLQPFASPKDQKLTAAIESEAVVFADPERLRQVFHNLIENAIKYTPPGGRITATLALGDGEAIVTVRDNGIGIAAESLPRVFDRFYRVDKSNSPAADGAGLGLSIVRSIISTLGGRVEVESRLGEGSVFRVFLPIAANGTSKTHNRA